MSALIHLVVPLDVPVGWSTPDDVEPLRFLAVVAGLPILLFIAIALTVYVPSLVRGEPLLPGSQPDDQWLGGPGATPAELEAAASSADDTVDTGGASGTW